ncbi:hypothetical protein ASNO1_37460 [Corallococcus caeni]|uniref:DUF3619 family protein n=1 Tax=Corallococcus caeni TaxID=3082388 RepID=A0ABQ6QTZ1_9BACT|nr:hypothetical protein ASNO1_37460 [Corallococcus sp. NO1]
MSETSKQEHADTRTSSEKSASLTLEDARRLASEGLQLRRDLEERISRAPRPATTDSQIRFR